MVPGIRKEKKDKTLNNILLELPELLFGTTSLSVWVRLLEAKISTTRVCQEGLVAQELELMLCACPGP